MKYDDSTIGVVLAAGRGTRFSAVKPKQFHNLAGKPILEYPVAAFAEHKKISEIYIVYPAGFAAEVESVAAKYRAYKPVHLVEGGETRAASTRAAIRAIGVSNDVKILFHDAVRPFLTSDILDNCIDGLDTYDSVDTVVPAVDTIVKLEPEMAYLESIPSRALLRRGQTPQGFWLKQLETAYQDLTDEQLNRFTDDCGVLLNKFPEVKIGAVAGHENNVKITSPMDLFIAEQILFSGITSESIPATAVDGSSVAVIFGGTSGLGLAAAERLKDLGWSVEIASRSTGVDVRNFEQVSGFLSETQQKHGHINLVANFAGVLKVGPLNDMTLDDVDNILSINFMGSINVSRAAHRYLKETKGHLVMTASSSYYRGRGDTAAYSASKAAVVNLTQALAEEWASEGIIVSCIVPRRADTPMRRNAFPDEDQAGNLKPGAVADAIMELHTRQQTGIIKHVY